MLTFYFQKHPKAKSQFLRKPQATPAEAVFQHLRYGNGQLVSPGFSCRSRKVKVKSRTVECMNIPVDEISIYTTNKLESIMGIPVNLRIVFKSGMSFL